MMHPTSVSLSIKRAKKNFLRKKSILSSLANADMQSRDIRKHCKVDEQGQELLKMAITQLGLSARAYNRILKVARTIADLAGS
jgi:magnesium chelatase family protein